MPLPEKKFKRPKGCLTRNCVPLSEYSHYDPDEPYSDWCCGYRTGGIKGKENAIKNVPSDIMTHCILIGSHSESLGKYTFIYNIPDLYLQLRKTFNSMWRLGLLRRTMRRVIVSSKDEVGEDILLAFDDLKRMRENKITEGTKFIEFHCSCGEEFFREYNHHHHGKYYKPNKEDKVYMRIHTDLGHTIMYRKCKRVKKSSGPNKSWQEWKGEYKFS